MSAFHNAAVVVIHGAWADGSSWEPVIRRLQNEGLHVVAAPIPLGDFLPSGCANLLVESGTAPKESSTR